MPKSKPPTTPSYRCRPGYSQALVTLTDSLSRKRRDYWLGEYGTPESWERYHRLIAEWERKDRRLPARAPLDPGTTAVQGRTISEIIREYWHWAQAYYHPHRWGAMKTVLQLLRRYYGQTPAAAFGPKSLRLLREEMIRGADTAERGRGPWSRKYINSQVQCIRHLFKWAAAEELVPASVHQSLCTLQPLKRGRSAARETHKVGPVPQHLLDTTKPHLSRPVRALVELQLLTGARPGELLEMRGCDLEMDQRAGVWTYRPDRHKNAFRERERVIYLGPQAQKTLSQFMTTDRPTNAFLFSPIEAEAERRAALNAARQTPLSCGNRPGTHRQAAPQRKPGDHYTPNSYRRAIEYACLKAFPLPAPLARLPKEKVKAWRERIRPQWAEVKAWRQGHRWHPHQLRHNAATLLRREFGLEAAQLALGHASAQITDAVYAERDHAKVVEIMRKIG